VVLNVKKYDFRRFEVRYIGNAKKKKYFFNSTKISSTPRNGMKTSASFRRKERCKKTAGLAASRLIFKSLMHVFIRRFNFRLETRLVFILLASIQLTFNFIKKKHVLIYAVTFCNKKNRVFLIFEPFDLPEFHPEPSTLKVRAT